MACQFFLSGEVLYKRNHDSTLIYCVNASEANHLMEEMHERLLGAHAGGPLLARNIMRAGYYWLTMENDCIKHGHATIAKPIKIRRMLLINLCTL